MDSQNNSDLPNTTKKGLTTSQKIMIAGFAVLILVIASASVIIYKALQKPAETAAGNLIVDESNLSTIGQQLEESIQDGMFEVNMNTTWTFPDALSPSGDAYIANSTANHYPISFDILLGEEQEIIYSSSVIPVGSQIKEIKLDKELEPGTYSAICFYHLWKEDGTENSTFGVNISLVVE